jgi:hypothetical protein
MRTWMERNGAALRRRLLCRRPEALAGFFSFLFCYWDDLGFAFYFYRKDLQLLL